MQVSDSGNLILDKASLIQAVIFDMDGTLVDSEPLWKEAEIDIFNRAGLKLSEEKLQDSRGMPTLDAVKFWLNDLDIENNSPSKLASEINIKAEELILSKGKIMPGAIEVLEFFNRKSMPMAIASSSGMSLIEGVVKKHHLEGYFNLLYSGDAEPVGKPHPGIFLSTARELKVDPCFCVVFEDSVNGILSAKAANMKVIAFLSDGNTEDTKYDIADMKLESFYNFGNAEYEYLELLMKKH